MKQPTLQERMDEVEHVISVISTEITEIIQILRNNSIKIEAIAAKIINDLSNKIDKCECSKEILSYLKEKEPICKEIKESHDSLRRYTPPNFMVNPNTPAWSFGEPSK